MGNCTCGCLSPDSESGSKEGRNNYANIDGTKRLTNQDGLTDDSQQSPSNLQHIKDRDDQDETFTPSDHPKSSTLFLDYAIDFISAEGPRNHHLSSSSNNPTHKRVSSCSTIFVDDSTVSQPNIKATIKCVSWAVYYLIKQRDIENSINSPSPDIFDEKLHPLTKERVPATYNKTNPEHRHIYRFIRTLFSSAQLTAECAIVTLIYLERLLTYAEFELCPANWKRIVLGAILLASKVWDDQAVWNVDYCQILRDITVEDMNELERQFLELLQFNINVPSSVYAKYYFDLRYLADKVNVDLPVEQLNKEKAQKLEATSRICEDKFRSIVNSKLHRSISADHLAVRHNSSVILS